MKKHKDIVCWWSGGITSAVACKKAIDIYGLDRCIFIFLGTGNEDPDTYRFKKDCESWYGAKIHTLTQIGKKWKSIQDIWEHYLTLNSATGAICSSELKRDVRLKFEKQYKYTHQVFGFDLDEAKRVKSLFYNHPQAKPIFPLLMFGLLKKECIKIVQEAGIEPPRMYQLGFKNNNCFQTGCIQGGIGYWKKMKEEFPEKFNAMADMEHRLTDEKGKPVTMLKDQSEYAKRKGIFHVFLKPHYDYPYHKSIDDMKGRPVEPLMECNGFCGTNDFDKRKETEQEINFEFDFGVDDIKL